MNIWSHFRFQIYAEILKIIRGLQSFTLAIWYINKKYNKCYCHIPTYLWLARLELLLTPMHSVRTARTYYYMYLSLIRAQIRRTYIRTPTAQRLGEVCGVPCLTLPSLVLRFCYSGSWLCFVYLDSAFHLASNILFMPSMTHACLTTSSSLSYYCMPV